MEANPLKKEATNIIHTEIAGTFAVESETLTATPSAREAETP